ncbi:MAG: type II secretion system F family protein [Acidobacteria bacterium]|nr:MAG: type II secretion system F family protein [Acidobacteriota bacterium]
MLYLIIFAVVAILIFGLGLSWDRGDRRVQQLRERLLLVEEAEQRESRASLTLIKDDLLSEIPALNRWLGQMNRGTALQSWLRQAGSGTRVGKFVLASSGSGLLTALLAMLWLPWYGAGLGLAGALLPYAWMRRRRTKRLAEFQAQFPEAIELLVRASRAGHPPSAALELIGEEMPEPIAGEFRQVFDQQRFGLPLRDCLLNLAQRVPLVDVQFFATSMIIQRESGGNLAEILDKLSHLIRERVKIQREVKTHTAQGRMTMWVLLAMAPLMLVVMLFLNRNLTLPLFHDPLGQGMLIGAAVLQLFGVVLLQRIVKIEV